MKKLNKLQINSERLLRNEALLEIKGGQYQNACTCLCASTEDLSYNYGYYIEPSGDCRKGCAEAFGAATGACAGY